MDPVIVTLLVALFGGLGAMTRFFVDGAVRGRSTAAYPVGTTLINLSGSLLLGLVTALALGAAFGEEWRLILGTGFLGGYTTFSTASFETVRLVEARRHLAAVCNGIGMLGASVGLAALGFWVGTILTGG